MGYHLSYIFINNCAIVVSCRLIFQKISELYFYFKGLKSIKELTLPYLIKHPVILAFNKSIPYKELIDIERL